MRWKPSVTRASLTALIFGSVAFVGFALLENSTDARARQRLNTTADLVQRSVQEGFDDVVGQLSAHAALFESSNEVTEVEFDRFAGAVAGAEGVRGWGVVVVVQPDELDSFIASARASNPSYSVFYDAESSMEIHYPILYWQSLESPLDPRGLDVATTAQGDAVERAIASGRPAASAIGEIRQLGAEGTLLAFPVTNPSDDANSMVVTAPVVVDEFIPAQLPASLEELVTVDLVAGESVSEASGVTRELAVGSQRWVLAIEPVPGPVTGQYASAVPWVPLGAVLVALVAGMTGFMLSRRGELQQKLNETLRLNEARDEFLGVIAHGIRTPLTAVVGFGDELRTSWPYLDDSERDEMLRIVHNQAHAVADIVADLLVIGRADIGTLYLSRRPVSVLDVLTSVLAVMPADQRDLIDVNADDVVADADPIRTGQVLRNLLVNALDSDARQVMVQAGKSRGGVWIQLKSDGAERPETFRDVGHGRYEFLPRPGDGMESSGLGVFVARRLVEAMGGHLVSRRQEGWTIVEVTLPAGARVGVSTSDSRR